MIRRALAIAAAAVVAVALALLPRFLSHTPEVSLRETAAASDPAIFPVTDELEGLALSGPSRSRSLQSFSLPASGVLINFWATWCPPCLEELPSLERLAEQLRQRDGKERVFLISVDEDPAAVAKLFRSLPYPIRTPVLWDRSGVLARRLGVAKFPESLWVGPAGDLRFRWIGPQRWLEHDVLATLRTLDAVPAR